MKKIKSVLLAIFVLTLLASCSREEHFISNEQQRAEVEQDFQKKMAQLPADLFDILNVDMPVRVKEALQFLYAYMPLSDLTEYSGD